MQTFILSYLAIGAIFSAAMYVIDVIAPDSHVLRFGLLEFTVCLAAMWILWPFMAVKFWRYVQEAQDELDE